MKTAALLERRRLPINGASRVGVVEGVSGGADGGGEGVSENGRDSETVERLVLVRQRAGGVKATTHCIN